MLVMRKLEDHVYDRVVAQATRQFGCGIGAILKSLQGRPGTMLSLYCHQNWHRPEFKVLLSSAFLSWLKLKAAMNAPR
jgi:hypothetical protein